MRGPQGFVAICGILLLWFGSLITAVPLYANETEYNELDSSLILPRAQDFYLRIMSLGASITKGQPAHPNDPNKNGYRKFLRDKLRSEGWQVNMVGSVSDWGNMNDRVSHAHAGLLIIDIYISDIRLSIKNYDLRIMRAGLATESIRFTPWPRTACPSTNRT